MEQPLVLHTRSQILQQDERGWNFWQQVHEAQSRNADETSLIICDMWDKHWSKGASERVDAMVERVNEVVKTARARGVQIIHSPSDTMDFYAGTPARNRVQEAPNCALPNIAEERAHIPLPIDDSDGGSDTNETEPAWVWTRQHEKIEIDQTCDGISDDGHEIYNFLEQKGIHNILILGVHTNMCILERSFGIKQMTRWGKKVLLVRDLTDAMYNPVMPPYVSHEKGTDLVIGYIEKFWCPTCLSTDILPASEIS